MKFQRTPSKQFGQSMTEYTVVLVFGVLALTTGPSGDTMQQLLDVMKENYEGYSYGVSLSEVPDYDSVIDYQNALLAEGISKKDIDKLATDPVKLYKDLKAYNKDPLKQITAGVNKLKNCISQIPSSVGQLQKKGLSC